MVDFPNPIRKTSLPQKRSHRNSVQNGPIERSTALTGTIFVTISVFMSQGPKVEPNLPPSTVLYLKKRRRRKNVCTEIPVRTVRSRGPQLLRGLFARPLLYLGLGAIFGQLLDNI